MQRDAWLFATVNPHINAGNPSPGARPVRGVLPRHGGRRALGTCRSVAGETSGGHRTRARIPHVLSFSAPCPPFPTLLIGKGELSERLAASGAVGWRPRDAGLGAALAAERPGPAARLSLALESAGFAMPGERL